MGQPNIDWNARFQQAALDPSGWLSALQDLADATGSARGQLIGVGGSSAASFNWANGFDAQAVMDFVEIDGLNPSLNFRIAAGLEHPSSTIVHEADYRRVVGRLSSDTYLDYCRHHEILFGCPTTLIAEDRTMIGLAVLRTERDGMTTPDQRQHFAHAMPGVRSAVHLQRAIEQQGMDLVAGTLEAMAANCLLIDGFGRIGALTPGAERAVSAGTVIRLVDGALCGATPVTTRRIAQAMNRVLANDHPARVELGRGLRLELFALARYDWAMSFRPRIVAVLRDPRNDIADEIAKVAREFSLSPAETQVAAMLTSGLDREEIAAQRGVSTETLKSQIKAIYQKTGCAREAELVALVAGLRI